MSPDVWATQLDRILVAHCYSDGEQEYVYLRLIGPPDRAVNLLLAPLAMAVLSQRYKRRANTCLRTSPTLSFSYETGSLVLPTCVCFFGS